MKYATWTSPTTSESWGAVVGDSLVDGPAALAAAGESLLPRLGDLIASTPATWARVAEILRDTKPSSSLSDVTLLPPYRPSGTIFAAGANYADHAEEAKRAGALDDLPASPLIFSKALSSICGPDAAIDWWSDLTQELDYEVELGAIIGREGHRVSASRALEHVFGYTVVNDITARDVQQKRPGGQWFLGKSMDTFCPIGPWIVTADEIGDPHNLDITLSVNGVEQQKSNTSLLLFTIDELIAEISNYTTLKPGDLIATGTPAGVGASADPPRFLQHNDVLEALVGGIGSLRNTVVRR